MSGRNQGFAAVAFGLVVWLLGAGFAPGAHATDLLAEVRLRGAILPDTTQGGADETLAEWTDSNSVEDAYHTRASGGELTSNASAGRMDGAIYSQTHVPGSFTRGSAFVELYLQQIDTYSIGAGSSGLSNGDPVKVRIEALMNSTLVLEGNPSGGSDMVFRVQGVPGVTGPWINFQTTVLYPPQDLEFDERWEIEVDTTVGSSFTLTSNFDATIGSASFTGPMEEPERSDATGITLVRVSHAKDFDEIDITAYSGAPTTPLFEVPALSPPALIALLAVLGATGAMFLRRR